MHVPQTILSQLGGNRFCAMTGANTFVGGETYLRFKVPKAKNTIKFVHIALNSLDLYDVKFLKRDGQTVVTEHEGVYGDQLESFFQDATGLYTRL